MFAHYSAWQAALSVQGMELAEQDFYLHSGTPSSKVIPMLAEVAGVEIEFERALGDKEAFFVQKLELLQPIAPVVQIAESHREQLPMAVASGGTRRLVNLQLKQIEIFDWFDTVVTCEDTEKHKPDPDVFLEAAARLGVPPQACRVYEDGEPGIEAARRAGMECVDVRRMEQHLSLIHI